ncbi:MAG: transcription elongation factor GreA [Deltaproteobacteria bacterium]|nr:transcription elongation factor GreA [Deltaproteobacteria bacterium]
MNKVPITRPGHERLYWQLQYLRRYARRQVANDLADAREFGITNRNLQWRTAREKQAWVESRIQDLTSKIASCEVIISPLGRPGRVIFGSWVRIHNLQTGQTDTFQMVGPYESDILAGRLSIASPVGRLLLNRAEGDRVKVQTPNGIRDYQVLAIFLPAPIRPGAYLSGN